LRFIPVLKVGLKTLTNRKVCDIIGLMKKIKMTIEYHSMPDKEGKCRFTLFWKSFPKQDVYYRDTGNRAQEFNADPRPHGFPYPTEEQLSTAFPKPKPISKMIPKEI